MSNLVVVESPAKAKTIKKYLGKNFEVLASYGHVRDLAPKNGAVDTAHGFKMKYQLVEKNAKHVELLITAMKKAEALYLATDPDREGEAIAWHVQELLKEKKALKTKKVFRVAFYEITKTAVNNAIQNPRELSTDLINAQQTRRALDFLVGFNLSPLLWKKIRRGLSAGRVQSPALRLIVEREEEIEKFIAQEYWSIDAQFEKNKQEITARLLQYQGQKVEQFSFTNETIASAVKNNLIKAADGKLVVSHVEKKQRKRNPTAPFITSTFQQESIRKLGYSAKRTMVLAQQLYEGIKIGKESVGLITYMRTDSVNLAAEAVAEIRDFIGKRYGKKDLPPEAREYKTKSKNAQEAHEAIRPTSVMRTPESIKEYLKDDQYKVYELIWKRTVASQMQSATIHTVAVDFSAGDGNVLRATGSTIVEPGFLKVYQEGKDDHPVGMDNETVLPPFEKGETVPLTKINAHQHFTEPPPRYSEASLVKTLEEFGIGRPSTYASIISTLQDRDYAILDNKRFKPTDVGRIVNKFLTEYFSQYIDYDFTAKLEDQLDEVSRGEKEWIPVLDNFWQPFKERVDHIQESVQRKDVTQEEIDEKCPECNKPLSIRLGKRGKFIGCSGYPDCKYTRNVDGDKNEAEIITDRQCPKCQSALQIKFGRYGKFIGCSGYPDCTFIEPLIKPEDTGITCPECQEGTILKRSSRRKRIFYSCSSYPKCKYALWNQPLAEPCPHCKWPILTLKITKRRGSEKVCTHGDCKFVEHVETAPDH